MFVNLDTLPRGKSLFTVYVTLDPAGTPRAECSADEVDVVGPRSASLQRLMEEGRENDGGANVGEYIWQTYGPGARVVGIVNQSDGYVVYDGFRTLEEAAP